jgi:hypothetical protein
MKEGSITKTLEDERKDRNTLNFSKSHEKFKRKTKLKSTVDDTYYGLRRGSGGHRKFTQ